MEKGPATCICPSLLRLMASNFYHCHLGTFNSQNQNNMQSVCTVDSIVSESESNQILREK
jgi:hypothetical protein